MGAASEDAHHHAECEDRRLCGQPDAGQRRHPDRHLGRTGTRGHSRAAGRAIEMIVRALTALLLAAAAALPASAQIAPTAAELRAYGGLHQAAARGDVA